MSMKKIVVTGATGQQGRETVRALLQQKQWQVVAITRNPSSKGTHALEKMGAEVVAGDLLDKTSLVAAFRGAHGVFAMSNPEAKSGKMSTDKSYEKAQLNNIIDACAACKVEHVVFSSAAKMIEADYPTGMINYDNKIEAKRRMVQLGFNLTCLGPSAFMSNIEAPWATLTEARVSGLNEGQAWVPWVSPEDIGVAAAQCFRMGPAAYGKEYFLIGDVMRGDDLAALLSKLRGGSRVSYSGAPALALRFFVPELYLMKTYYDKKGTELWDTKGKALYQACMEETRALVLASGCGRPALTFEDWLRLHEYPTKARGEQAPSSRSC